MEKENTELEADLELLAHTREIAATEAAIETLQIEEEKVKELMNIPLVPKRELTEKYVNDLPRAPIKATSERNYTISSQDC